MKKRLFTFLSVIVSPAAFGQDPATKPLPVPLTRPEMKKALEDLKERKPRFELPEPTKEEIEKAGERGLSYEGRLRSVYLNFGETRPARNGAGPGTGTGRAGGAAGGVPGQNNEPGMTLPYAFKTQLFWIVSRTNNCLY